MLNAITSLMRKNRVFISYARAYEDAFDKLYQYLTSQGYDVLNPMLDLHVGERWQNVINEALQKVVQEGIYVFLTGAESVQNEYQQDELQYFMSNNSRSILPLIVCDDDSQTAISRMSI